jgi:hypothetical protein
MSCLNEVNHLTDSGSLRQGENFQVRLDQYANIQENFDTITNRDSFQSDISENILSKTNKYFKNRSNNSKKFNTNLGNYSKITNDISNNRKQYNYRKDITNIYLNKNIRFSNGKIFHVTNQGIAKYVPPKDVSTILGKNGCPSTIMDINIPWNDKYLIKGQMIPTNPSLITGSNMKANGRCGNEGENLMVTGIITDYSEKYIGCFKDNVSQSNPTMTIMGNVGNVKKNEFSFDDCKAVAIDGGKKYFALQNVNAETQRGYCAVSNDITKAKKNAGVLPNQKVEIWKAQLSPIPASIATLTKNGSLKIMKPGGASIFSTTLESDPVLSNYFLIVEDNGNVSIYKGTNLIDKKELIWQSGTTGKSLEINDNYTARKCKFGSNIMQSNATLASGEFIGSPTGSCYLIMQPDGNLVLYTSKTIPGCFTLKNNKQAGLSGVNSIYELAQTGNKKKIGSLYYIDQDANIVNYPGNKVKYGDTFTELKNYDSANNDIGRCKKSTLYECQQDCKNNPNCYAVNSGKWMKNKNFANNLYPLKNSSLFIRDKKVVENFTGSSKKTTRVAENILNNYSPNNTSNVDNLSTSISPRDLHLKRLQETQLNTSVDNLNQDSKIAQSNFFSQNNQLFNNTKTINGYYSEYNSNDDKLENENKYLNNYERIVNDSNTVLLQEYRIYIFLFILLILCLIIFIQVIKLNKQ